MDDLSVVIHKVLVEFLARHKFSNFSIKIGINI